MNESRTTTIFSKKYLLLIICFVLFTCGLLVLTFVYVLRINWNDFANLLFNGLTSATGWVFLFLAILCRLINMVISAVGIYLRLRESGIKVGFANYVSRIMICTFLSLICPISIIQDAYIIYWLKSCGVKSEEAVSYSFFITIVTCISQIIITIPAWIWILANTSLFWQTSEGQIAYLLTFWGMGLYVATFILQFSLGSSKRIHYYLSRVWNRTKQFLNLNYHTKAETHKKYVVDQKMKQIFFNYFKKWKLIALLLVLAFVSEVVVYSFFLCCVAFSNINFSLRINYFAMFGIIDIVSTSNSLIPLPGVSFQFLLKVFMSEVGGVPNGTTKDMFIANSIAFNTIINICINIWGVIWLVIAYIEFFKGIKKKRS